MRPLSLSLPLLVISFLVGGLAIIENHYRHRCQYQKHRAKKLLPVHPIRYSPSVSSSGQIPIRLLQEDSSSNSTTNSTSDNSSSSSSDNATFLGFPNESESDSGNATSSESNATSSESGSDNATASESMNYTVGPLRIFVDYSNCNTTKEVYKLIKKIFRKMVKVINRYFKINQTINLMKFEYKYCYEAVVPKRHRTHGIRNTDLVLYVSAENDEYSGSVAWASPCFLDDSTNRPVAAQVDLNLFYLLNETSSTIAAIVLHELLHAMGFASDFFALYKYPNGSNIPKEAIYKRSEPNNLIIIPELVQMAREHFNCSSLTGVPLEKGMGLGSDNSHWAEEFFAQEMMSPVEGINQVISNFTLTFFKHMGWYEVSYNNRSSMTWGRNKSCRFTRHKCYGQRGLIGEYCTNLGGRGCTPDSRFLSVCWNSYSRTHCPMNYAAQKCSTPLGEFNQTGYEYYGSIRKSGSKCLKSDIARQDFYESYATSQNDWGYKCIQADCASSEDGNDVIRVRFDNYTLQCNASKVWISPGAGAGYGGIILCPDIKEFCQTFPKDCLHGCNGNGLCVNGKCDCFDFINGTACNSFGQKFEFNGTGLSDGTAFKHKPQYFF